jgi:hypothetical protein
VRFHYIGAPEGSRLSELFTIAPEKPEAWSDTVAACQAKFSGVTLHCPAVPDGRSTVKLLINTQN